MKIKISLFLLILISFLNMGAISDRHMINKSFYEIESSILNKTEFNENGAKAQFKTKKAIKDESLIIKEKLINEIKGLCIESNENKFEISNIDFNISVNLWSIDDYTYVEVVLTNSNPKYNTKKIKEIVVNLKDKDTENMQTFLYYRGKLRSKKADILTDKKDGFKNLNIIKINNGYTGTGILKDGEKVNFALANYDTNSYIIVGTPIIFTTY